MPNSSFPLKNFMMFLQKRNTISYMLIQSIRSQFIINIRQQKIKNFKSKNPIQHSNTIQSYLLIQFSIRILRIPNLNNS